MDGVITLPVAIAGYFFLPDLPDNTKAWYLKPEVSCTKNQDIKD